MICECGYRMSCIDSRANKDGVRRRHHCEKCDERITTQELPVDKFNGMKKQIKLLRRFAELAKKIAG